MTSFLAALLLIGSPVLAADMLSHAPTTANLYIISPKDGQTEAMVSLPAGEHTLQLLLGNYSHVPHDNPVLSQKIEVTVN